MATPRTIIRPFLRTSTTPFTTSFTTTLPTPQTRTFLPGFPFPFASTSTTTPPQTLTATRTLPYASAPIYSIVADISSYSSFLPYCDSSLVIIWSAPDATYSRRWPSAGTLTVGFKGLSESFTSRVYCVPGKVVESVGGRTETSLPAEEIRHHLDGDGGRGVAARDEGGLMTHLRSRWTIDALGRESTQVTLALEFAFSNPLYTALSAGVAPKVADVMVEAFEERVRVLLKRDAGMRGARLEELEGSAVRR